MGKALSEYSYFIAAGRSLEAVQQWQTARREVHEKIEELRVRVGADAGVNRGTRVDGFAFAGAAPQGWQEIGKAEGKPYFAPTRRSKAGKELRDQMAAIKVPHVEEFARLIGMGPYFSDDYRIRYVTFETVDEVVVIRVPNDRGEDKGNGVPPDANPLKVSAYYAMKEAAEATDTAAQVGRAAA